MWLALNSHLNDEWSMWLSEEVHCAFPLEMYWRMLERYTAESVDHGDWNNDLALSGVSLSDPIQGLPMSTPNGTIVIPFVHNRPPRYGRIREEEEWEIVSDFQFDDENVQILNPN